MENNIPSVEEFMGDMTEMYLTSEIEAKLEKVKEFTKLHVKAALETVNRNIKYEFIPENHNSFGKVIINKDSILNAYPEENIIIKK